MPTRTKGNVIVEDIRVGDIHYEYEWGVGVKTQVLTQPVRDEHGCWSWKSKNLNTGAEVDYTVCEQYPQYSVNLYDYEAYNVKVWM